MDSYYLKNHNFVIRCDADCDRNDCQIPTEVKSAPAREVSVVVDHTVVFVRFVVCRKVKNKIKNYEKKSKERTCASLYKCVCIVML